MSKWSTPWPRQRDAVKRRSGGVCEVCGKPAEQIHHRLPRGMGGTRDPRVHNATNLLHVCLPCHAYIEKHREEAIIAGWLVSRYSNPAEVAVLVDNGGRYVYLTPDGYAAEPVVPV